MNNCNISTVVNGGGGGNHVLYEKIISLENLFESWNEFKRGKEKKIDIQNFGMNLEDHLYLLCDELRSGAYQHGKYTSFLLHDPKLRHISKAFVKDRLVHHAVMRIIEPIFERSFIFDSYSSRLGKGTHRAVNRFRQFAWKLSRNAKKTVWVLQCDIRKFFDSVDHEILMKLVQKKIRDQKALQLIQNIIESFSVQIGKGIPLGNVTSQLFANVYLDPFDQWMKRNRKVMYYLRYADDFAVLGSDKSELVRIIPSIDVYLQKHLSLLLHQKKITLRKWHQGIDFLGYISFPHYTVLRTRTKRRMMRKLKMKKQELHLHRITPEHFEQSLQSYLGILRHARSYRIVKKIAELLSANEGSTQK